MHPGQALVKLYQIPLYIMQDTLGRMAADPLRVRVLLRIKVVSVRGNCKSYGHDPWQLQELWQKPLQPAVVVRTTSPFMHACDKQTADKRAACENDNGILGLAFY